MKTLPLALPRPLHPAAVGGVDSPRGPDWGAGLRGIGPTAPGSGCKGGGPSPRRAQGSPGAGAPAHARLVPRPGRGFWGLGRPPVPGEAEAGTAAPGSSAFCPALSAGGLCPARLRFAPKPHFLSELCSQGSGCPHRGWTAKGASGVRDEPWEETGALTGPHVAPLARASPPVGAGERLDAPADLSNLVLRAGSSEPAGQPTEDIGWCCHPAESPAGQRPWETPFLGASVSPPVEHPQSSSGEETGQRQDTREQVRPHLQDQAVRCVWKYPRGTPGMFP